MITLSMMQGLRVVVLPGAIVASLFLFASCSIGPRAKDANVEYLDARNRPPLEVPPDLNVVDQSESFRIPLSGEGKIEPNMLLPEPEGIKLVREGEALWLEVNARPEPLWPKLRMFWAQQGVEVERDEPLLGLMDTAWIAESPAVSQVPPTGVRTGASYDEYSISTLNKYRIRLERLPEVRGVRLFLTHRSIHEVLVDDSAAKTEDVWVKMPGDPELAAEMLLRLLVFLGVNEQRARGILNEEEASNVFSHAYIDTDAEGNRILIVRETLYRLWPRLGSLLESLNLEIEEENQQKGRFAVTYRSREDATQAGRGEVGETGVLGKWFSFSRRDQKKQWYEIVLQEQPGGTRIVVLNEDELSDSDRTEATIISQLHARLQ